MKWWCVSGCVVLPMVVVALGFFLNQKDLNLPCVVEVRWWCGGGGVVVIFR